MSYCHERTFDVRYTDVDFKDELKLSAYLAFAQEAACSSGEELGFGYEVLRKQNYAFMIVSTHCEILRPVRLGERITVQTWPLPPRHVIFERDYRILDEKGEVCANLASRWVLVDLSNTNLLSPDRLSAHAICPYNAQKSLSPVWKIPKLERRDKPCATVRATNSLCDHYLHVNNTRYADLFLDCFTMEELAEKEVTGFSVSYNQQVKEGSLLTIYQNSAEEGILMEAWTEEGLSTQFSLRVKARSAA